MDSSGPDSPFADVLVRQAVSHAIDKDNLVRIFGGRSIPAGCIFPPGLPGHDEACDPYPYSVEKAQELMAQAGNTGFSTQLYTDTSELSRLYAESIIADLAKIGIEVELIQMDWDALLTTTSTPHAAPLSTSGWLQDFPDPADFLDPILTCAAAVEGGANLSWFCDPSIDERLAEARTISDLEEAVPIYQAIQADVMAQAPFVPTTFPLASGLVSERVAGVRMHPLWYWDLGDIAVGQ
jgi:ABC-type transport system substrate-binding protein